MKNISEQMADPLSSFNDEGKEKALDYIGLLHDSGKYEKQTAKIIPFADILMYDNAVSVGTGNFLIGRTERNNSAYEGYHP